MKSTSHCKAATIICIMAALILSSCIYEAPGDRFYRTLWESDPDTPFGTVTLEFLCGEQISVSAPSCIGSFGTYEGHGLRTIFSRLTLSDGSYSCILTEATRNGDELTLIWYGMDGDTPLPAAVTPSVPMSGNEPTTRGSSLASDDPTIQEGIIVMHRLSEYK